MRLSDAILKGGSGRRQANFDFVSDDGSCCVFGAALIGVLGFEKAKSIEYGKVGMVVSELFPIIGRHGGSKMWNKMMSMHAEGASFEAVAAWVKTVEDTENSNPKHLTSD